MKTIVNSFSLNFLYVLKLMKYRCMELQFPAQPCGFGYDPTPL